MTRTQQPLSVEGQDEAGSFSDRQDAENQALLTGQIKETDEPRWQAWRERAAFLWAFSATVAMIVLAVLYQHQVATKLDYSPKTPVQAGGKKNLIFMVSDGMGPASLSLTRSYRQAVTGLPIGDVLVLDQHMIGQSRTRSSSSLVTDSAAGATAFSCGMKSYNGAISVLPDHTLCGTVLEAAKRAGYTTGLVVTTRITDATPACFASHVNMRREEDSIARQLIGEHPLGHVVDLMFGGGRCHFLPKNVSGSCRSDFVDVVQNARERGYKYLNSREEFDKLHVGANVRLPILGLFSPTDIPYEIDRRVMNDTYPSLDEMAKTALTALKAATADSEKGFFLMIEGSRIDHAGHGNDPAAQVHEVLAYDKTFASVLDFLNRDETDGLLVATSDHETGGLALARQLHESYPEYRWFPGVLANASHSGENLAFELQDFIKNGIHSSEEVELFIRQQANKGLGVTDISDEEVAKLMQAKDSGLQVAYIYADIVSRRAQIGWSTHGHSATDVNIYASSARHAAALQGNHENTEVGRFLAEFLDVDVNAVTNDLNKIKDQFVFENVDGSDASWLGKALDFDQEAGAHLVSYDHYSGDFRKREESCSHHQH